MSVITFTPPTPVRVRTSPADVAAEAGAIAAGSPVRPQHHRNRRRQDARADRQGLCAMMASMFVFLPMAVLLFAGWRKDRQ